MPRRTNILENLDKQDLDAVVDYLSMTDQQKAQDAAYSLHYYWEDWFEDEFDAMNKPEIIALTEDMESYEIINLLDGIEKHEHLVEDFGKWLIKNISNFMANGGVHETDIPAWYFMDSPEKLEDVYVIRASDFPHDAISHGGFHGVTDFTQLAYTTRFNRTMTHKKGGFVFGYTERDFKKYGTKGNGYKYGSHLISFKVKDAVRIWHHGDEEYQVIFLGNDISDPRFPEFSHGSGFEIEDEETGEMVYTDTLEELHNKTENVYEAMSRTNKQAYQQAKIFFDMLAPLIERFKDVSHYRDSKGDKFYHPLERDHRHKVVESLWMLDDQVLRQTIENIIEYSKRPDSIVVGGIPAGVPTKYNVIRKDSEYVAAEAWYKMPIIKLRIPSRTGYPTQATFNLNTSPEVKRSFTKWFPKKKNESHRLPSFKEFCIL